MTQQQDVGGEVASEALAGGLRVGSGGRHRRHVFPGRDNVVKVRYADEERLMVGWAAELTGLRPSGFVAAAALLLARGLVAEGSGAPGDGEAELPRAVEVVPLVVPPVLGGRSVVVAWSVGEHQAVLEELVQARLALRRYGVNVNQAVAALNSGGQVPVWLEQAVAGSDRAVARVDAATAVLTRRLI